MLSAIVQARMGSTRLPGKILMDVNGKSLLEYLIERLQSVKAIKQVIVATTEKPQDEEEAKKYEEFFAVLNDLPEQLDEEVLKFRGVEADDILAYMVKKYEQI